MRSSALAVLVLGLSLAVTAQTPNQSSSAPTETAKAAADYSGMYSFLRDGEFLQLTIEDDGRRVTGFVSRYGDLESDRGAFLNQFLKDAKLDGNKLTFKTETVHGIWFEFNGSAVRGPGKTQADEGYFLLKGTLSQNSTDAAKKTSSQSRLVAFKSFPQDADQPTPPPHD